MTGLPHTPTGIFVDPKIAKDRDPDTIHPKAFSHAFDALDKQGS
jgi:hypothetical protein